MVGHTVRDGVPRRLTKKGGRVEGQWTDSAGSDSEGPAHQLEALRLIQHELWTTLRSEDDPEVRMALLARFGENRVAIDRLTEQLGGDDVADEPPGYRVELVDGPAQNGHVDQVAQNGQVGRPRGLGDLMGAVTPPGDANEADVARAQRDEPLDEPGLSSSYFTAPSAPIGPMADRFSAPPPPPVRRPTDRDAGRPTDRPTDRPAARPVDRQQRPAPVAGSHEPRSVGASASVTAERSAGSKRSSDSLSGFMPTFLSSNGVTGESPQRALVLLGGLLAVLGLAWFVLSGPSDEETASTAASDVVATGDEQTPAGPSADEKVKSITDVLHGLGLANVVVERRGEVILLSGTVETDAARQGAVGAAQAMAGDDTIDAAALVVEETQTPAAPSAPAGPVTGRAAALQAEINRVIASTPLIFGSGETSLTELHVRILNTVASILLAYPELPVTIVGFTDDTGDDASNRQLSLDRAAAAKDYLVSQGVPATSLGLDAQGEDTASGSNALANLERRVEFVVTQPEGAPLAPSDTPLRIAIVAPSARNDLAFTQSMVDAVEAVQAERGNVEIAITDNTFVPEEAAAAIRGYAAQDYDLVIAHGSQFGGPLLEIAPEFPNVAFAWGTASDTFGLANVYAYDAASEQGGFVLGSMSAQLSANHRVGVVGPIEVGDAQRYVDGFEAGAKGEATPAEVLVTYTGSFSDLTLAAEAAQSHIGAGADVMTGSAQMVVGAVSIANDAGVLWFGTQSNQSSLSPGLVVASQVYHWEVLLRQIVNDIDAGTKGGRTYTADLANGGLVIEYNPGYALPDAVRQRADQITAGIVSGSIVVPGG